MFEKDILDLGRCDVLAAPDDGVIGASFHEQVAVLVHPPAIAGGEPSVVIEHASRTEVFAGYLLATRMDVAGGADRQRPMRSADLDLDAGKESTGRTETGACARIALQCGAVVFGTEDGDGGAGLRQAVGVDEFDAGK